MATFAELGINARTLAALSTQGITEPVEVQAGALPELLDGHDVVIEAPTGSGKSLAFLLPIVEGLGVEPGPGPRAIVVTPTRELAVQVERVWQSLATPFKCALLYGGVGYATQTLALKQRPDIVIGTPGRILDMVGRKLLSLARIEYAVLDEADEMLDAGFAPDVERILAMTFEPQMVMASATMPLWVQKMIDKHMHEPRRIKVSPPEESRLEHGMLRVSREDKIQVLSRLLRMHRGTAIAFGRTKHGVAKLSRDLQRMGHQSLQLQGNLSQPARDRAMEAFRSGRNDVLIATNVAARGLDISHVGLVINFDLPDTPQWLTHRVGRTARNGAEGRALTFITPEDRQLWARLRREGAPELPVVDSDHLLATGEWRYVTDAELQAPHGHVVAPHAQRLGTGTAPRRRSRGGRGRRPAAPSGEARA